MDRVKEVCEMEAVHHVASSLNPADIATRGNSSLDDIGPDSFWQTGPSFLCSPRDVWPVTRDFVRGEIPNEEKRHAGQAITAAVRAAVVKKNRDFPDLNSNQSILPITHQVLCRVLEQNNSLESRKRWLP